MQDIIPFTYEEFQEFVLLQEGEIPQHYDYEDFKQLKIYEYLESLYSKNHTSFFIEITLSYIYLKHKNKTTRVNENLELTIEECKEILDKINEVITR